MHGAVVGLVRVACGVGQYAGAIFYAIMLLVLFTLRIGHPMSPSPVVFPRTLVHPRERVYFGVLLVFSVLVYLGLIVSVVGIPWILLWAVLLMMTNGVFWGRIRGNALRITDGQFSEVHRIAVDLAQRMGLREVPAMYVLQAGGVLNAFASRFFRRNYVVIFSDVLELAYAQGMDAVTFVVAHEFAHIHRNHFFWRLVLSPGMIIPFLGTAYQRAAEYTGDRYGVHFAASGALDGLLALAAGKHLYQRVDLAAVVQQSQEERGCWVRIAEWFSPHPHLTRRIAAAHAQREAM